jgi:ABC-type Fe3+/spermidine/putrescine transport system ATPase subunit
MAGLYQPDEGEILVDGSPTKFATPREAHLAGIATVHQELLLFPELTVAENIFLGQAPKTSIGMLDWPAMRSSARRLLDSLDRSRCREAFGYRAAPEEPRRGDCICQPSHARNICSRRSSYRFARRSSCRNHGYRRD